MPKHKINGKKLPKQDPIMEKIHGRIKTANIPQETVQAALGLKERAARDRLSQNGGEWKIKDLSRMAKFLEIPLHSILAEASEEFY